MSGFITLVIQFIYLICRIEYHLVSPMIEVFFSESHEAE